MNTTTHDRRFEDLIVGEADGHPIYLSDLDPPYLGCEVLDDELAEIAAFEESAEIDPPADDVDESDREWWAEYTDEGAAAARHRAESWARALRALLIRSRLATPTAEPTADQLEWAAYNRNMLMHGVYRAAI